MTKRTSATSSASGSSTSATGSASSASEGEADKTSSVATAAAPPTQPTEPSTPQDSQTADPSIKPISSKPMDPSSKPSSAIITIKPSSTATRRSSSSFDSRKKNKKKPRTSAASASASELRRRLTASSSSGRFWSESDELAILRGLVRFIAEKSDGAVPASATEVTPFLEFIRGTLGVNPAPTQLSDKIRRLRMKYNNAVPALDWSTPHDVTAANLAKKIWSGGGGGAGSPVKEEPKSSSRKRSKSSARTARKASKSFFDGFSLNARSIVLENGLGDASVEEELAVEDGGVDRHLFLNESLEVCRDVSKTGFTEGVLKKGLGLLRGSKARELEEKWRELWELENELLEKRVKLVKEQMREISYALKLAGRAWYCTIAHTVAMLQCY